jgi:hypothetical protein
MMKKVLSLITILHIILQDEPEIKQRVVAAMGLLVGAKVLNVCVPYLFKLGVDSLGPVADFTSTVDTVSSFTFAVLVGCKEIMSIKYISLSNEKLLYFRWYRKIGSCRI